MKREHAFRIAFLACASYRMDREAALDVHRKAASHISRLISDLQVDFSTVSNVPASDDEFAAAVKELARVSPDALILQYAGWTEDQTVLKIVQSFECPVMLWATSDLLVDGISKLVSHVGYMEASSFLKKMHKPFLRFYGGPDAVSDAELRAFIVAAKGLAQVRHLRFGWIGQGYGSEGILDTQFCEDVVEKKVGVRFVKIDLEEVFKRYKSALAVPVPAACQTFCSLRVETQDLRQWLRGDIRTVDDSVRIVQVLEDIAAEHELAGLSLRCFPEFKKNDVPSPCLAISAMNQSDIPASCEGDVLSGVSMYILSRLSGYPATMMDVLAYDEDHNTMELFHCGSAAPMLAGPQRVVEYKTRCKPRNHRAGVTVEFPLRPGHVSFLKMDMLGEGCKLFYYKGEVTTPTCELRGNQATIRPDTRVKALIEKLLDHGVSHHQVLSLGDVTREVKYFAELAGLELVCL